MTEKARMGIDHRESACSKSSRRPNTKHGATQLSTTDTCAASTCPQSQASGQFQHTECITGRRGQRNSRTVPKVTWFRESQDATQELLRLGSSP